ncbi:MULTISPECIES: transposase [unclassified Acidithiobacillus]|uniref:transposase n=1 Tax=unclassified Acidithiobacillus TaxID=2614800 RepID=UPI001D0D0ADE|nr:MULTISPECIES: transposase [unclassified Acidithiobacillus]
MLEILQAQTGPIEALVADTGYCSEKRKECGGLRSAGDYPIHCRGQRRTPSRLAATAYRTGSPPGKCNPHAGRSVYRLRKQTVEPVFGIIKSVMGFRQFSLRGLRQVQGEWSLVCLAWNIKRMAVLRL